MLTGKEIHMCVQSGRIIIDPYDPDQLRPNSYDVRLSPVLLRIVDTLLDVKFGYVTEMITIPPQGMALLPSELYLGATMEWTHTPHHVPLYEGRSTMARYFISSHQTAGFGDIGFAGHWTLEIMVARTTVVYPKMRIGQLAFYEPTGITDTHYAGSYCEPRAGDLGCVLPVPAKPNNF